MLDGIDPQDFAGRAATATRLLKELANERRLMILCALAEGERSVGELADAVGLGQSAVSQHLARLRAAGIVATRRAGQTIYYRVADRDAARVIETLAAIYCPPPAAPKRRRRTPA